MFQKSFKKKKKKCCSAVGGVEKVREVILQTPRPVRRGVCPEGSCRQWREAHTGAGFLTETAARGGPTLEQVYPEGL